MKRVLYPTGGDLSQEKESGDGETKPPWGINGDGGGTGPGGAFPGAGKIAFASNRDGNGEVYAMDSDGQNPTNLTNNGAFDDEPDWGVAVDDVPQCAITGTEGRDFLQGTSGDDVIWPGRQRLHPRLQGGDDTSHGGAGKDLVLDVKGNDTLKGGEADNLLIKLDGVNGNDALSGTSGDDRLPASARKSSSGLIARPHADCTPRSVPTSRGRSPISREPVPEPSPKTTALRNGRKRRMIRYRELYGTNQDGDRRRPSRGRAEAGRRGGP